MPEDRKNGNGQTAGRTGAQNTNKRNGGNYQHKSGSFGNKSGKTNATGWKSANRSGNGAKNIASGKNENGARSFAAGRGGATAPRGKSDFTKNGPARGTGVKTEKPDTGAKTAYGSGRGTAERRSNTEKPFTGRPSSGKPSFGRPSFGTRSRGNMNRGAIFRTGKPAETAKKPGVVEGMESRRLALKVLRDVTENGAYASLSLDRNLTECTLNPADRRLVSRLVYDTLEHLLYIDHALSQVMAKPDTDIKLRNILRLGACQILIEDRIPESAATNTSVELCTELGMEALKGVCNGILRNLVREKDQLKWPDPETEPDEAASIRYSVPLWLVRKLRSEWGAQAEQMMAWHEPETGMTVHPNLMDVDDAAFEKILEGKVWEHETSRVPHAWKIRGVANVARDTDFLAGHFSIQNESSMMACMAVAPKRGWQILDCCAAPGGKACLLAEMMNGTGRVQAWELHEHRTALISAQMKRLRLENVRPMTRDASRHREEMERSMDAVLLDAPCSGLGAMAGKPDVRYRVTEESVEELTGIQKNLLDAVCDYVKPGGVLVYSTCSVLKEENEDQITAFLARHPNFSVEKLPETIPACFRQYEGTGLQLFEYRDHVEGFYICRLRRNDE